MRSETVDDVDDTEDFFSLLRTLDLVDDVILPHHLDIRHKDVFLNDMDQAVESNARRDHNEEEKRKRFFPVTEIGGVFSVEFILTDEAHSWEINRDKKHRDANEGMDQLRTESVEPEKTLMGIRRTPQEETPEFGADELIRWDLPVSVTRLRGWKSGLN